MKLLRQTIRQLIKESLCDQANDKIKGAIDILERDGLEVILNNPVHWFKKGMSRDMSIYIYPKGEFETDPIGNAAVGEFNAEKANGECLDAFITSWTNVSPPYRGKGIGALLYDIAIELSGKHGIASDREEVSSDALKNWNYMKRQRWDIRKRPLDTQWGTYTPDDDWDDCGDTSWLAYEDDIPFDNSDWPPRPLWEEIPENVFQNHSLNNVYNKINRSMPTVSCLKEKGLIRWVR